MAHCACRASYAGLVCELILAVNEGMCILCCACSSVHSGMNLLHWVVYVGLCIQAVHGAVCIQVYACCTVLCKLEGVSEAMQADACILGCK